MHYRRFHGARATELFSTLAYDPDTHLFVHDDQSLGFGFVCEPLSGADSAQADRLSVLLNCDWPPQTGLQVGLWASPDLEEHLARMQALRVGASDALLREATHRRAGFLRAGTTQPLGAGSDLRLRNLLVLVTVKLPLAAPLPSEKEIKDALALLNTAFQVLKTTGLHPEHLTADRYVRLHQAMLNWEPQAGWRDLIVPEWDRNRLVREQLLDLSHALTVEHDGLTLGAYRAQTFSVKRFPDRAAFGIAGRYISDYISGTRGIRHNVLITLNVSFPDPEATRTALAAKQQWATHQSLGPLANYMPALATNKRSLDGLFQHLDNGDRPLQAYLGIVLFTPHDEAVSAGSNLRTYWRELGFQVMLDHYFVLPLFLHCLPFGMDREAIPHMQRYRTMSARHGVILMPVFGDWPGTGTPVINLVGRAGQLMSLNLFDSSTNYNAVIAASSGSGKSFLANELISTSLSVGDRCWVIDVGRSYEKLCQVFDGQFIAFTRDSTLSVNPFGLIHTWEEEADMVATLVTAMAAPTQPLLDIQLAGLKRTLKLVWDALGHDMTIDAIVAELAQSPDERLRDVGQQLYPFSAAGEYGRFFSGHNNIEFTSPFVVLELEELKGRKHLQQVVLLILIFQIQQMMYLGDRSQRKLVIIDEAWDLLTHGDVAKFIETGYRRFRKYNGAAVTITQSLADLYDNPTGLAIATNSANTFLLAQPSQAIDQLRAANRLPMPDGAAELLKTVHTVPGAYSEIMCLTDHGGGVGRLIVDPFNQLLYSTRPQDVAELARLRQAGLSVPDAITRLLADRTRGVD